MQVSFAGVVASDVVVVACFVAVLRALALICNAAFVFKPEFRLWHMLLLMPWCTCCCIAALCWCA